MKILKVFGPPGTGKTTTLMKIMEAELAAGTRPDRLGFLTFTVNARQVAMARAMDRFKLTKDDLPHFKTLHAIAYRELGVSRDAIIRGANDLRKFADGLGINFTFKQRHRDDDMMAVPMGAEAGDRLLLHDHMRRHNLQTVDEYWTRRVDDDLNIFQIRRFSLAFEAWKETEGLRDFTDLLEEVKHPLEADVVIVDEAQDLSKLQWKALHVLIRNCERLYIAGDDDQAIFTWAGADPMTFVNHPGENVVLGQSFRIPSSVHPLATRLAEGISGRQEKAWVPRAGEPGGLRFLPSMLAFEPVPDESYRLVYRHHYLGDPLEELMRGEGLPYARSDRPAPGIEWGKNIIMWERLRKGVELSWWETKQAVEGLVAEEGITTLGLKAIMRSNPKATFTAPVLVEGFGLNPATLATPWFEAFEKMLPRDRSYVRLMLKKFGVKALTEEPKIMLSTIHASKGAEADNVLLFTDMSKKTWDSLELNPDVERRTFYVGATRAKRTLTVIGANNPLFRAR